MGEQRTALIRVGDVPAALMLLTRLPVPGGAATDRAARAAWAWPLAGLAVAALAAVPGALALGAGLPPAVAAGLVLAGGVVLTGALHEDGLADVCDGIWGGATAGRRLEIMRDSRIGSYGVLALVLSVGLRWAALAALMAQGKWVVAVLGAAMLSRAGMAAVMHAVPPARPDGLSRNVGQPPAAAAVLAAVLALVLALVAAGPAALMAAAVAAMLALGVAALARARIGGQTGDVLGAVQQVGEIGALLAFAALA